MRALSISSADAFILVYDVTDAATFEEVRAIRDQIHETKATTAVPIVVVGNKTDLLAEDGELREVSNAVAEFFFLLITPSTATNSPPPTQGRCVIFII
ncbi:GH10248 [Drosophila grimshawi]|uniref:GH10248 n=1 Tax=Drosophila grimshawi TaxID=7222 RepID=B4K3Q1_DROGR|nr:GH10248 [Drosophila grimshawi]